MYKINISVYNYKYNIMSAVLKHIERDSVLPVILCIGSGDIAGDSLGPLTGSLLTHKYKVRTFVYGTLNRQVTARNITAVYNFIKKTHKGKVIAIDAALGKCAHTVSVYKGGIMPALAADKYFSPVGDYSIIANVNNLSCGDNEAMLKSASVENIKNLADNIAFAVNDAVMLYRAYRYTQKRYYITPTVSCTRSL